jgi:nondiscriminating aspartyl-tRNA synthetase
VFVTGFPRKKRPFYTWPDGRQTASFDLLFRGLEITTGGKRIHDYDMLVGELPKFSMKPEDLGDYLSIFRYGCPPHGGFAIGLERLTQKILGLENVKAASLFPRDRKRVRP